MNWQSNRISEFIGAKPLIDGQGYSYSFPTVGGEGMFYVNPDAGIARISIVLNEVELIQSNIEFTNIEVCESPLENENGISIAGNAGHVFISKSGVFYSVFFNLSRNRNA